MSAPPHRKSNSLRSEADATYDTKRAVARPPFLCRHVGEESVDRGAQLRGLSGKVVCGAQDQVRRAVGILVCSGVPAMPRATFAVPAAACRALSVISAAAAFCRFTALA